MDTLRLVIFISWNCMVKVFQEMTKGMQIVSTGLHLCGLLFANASRA